MTSPHCQPLVSVCIPHWQVGDMMRVCLRSLRQHSAGVELEILVVDNGSRDDSLDWLRSLPWIRLIERPGETPANWPMNVFTAWDAGAREARGRYFVTMHSDVFIKRDGWLAPFLRELARDHRAAATGAWKLELENPLYLWQKQVFGEAVSGFKRLIGRPGRSDEHKGRYPRDYCAMYTRDVLLQHNLTFCPEPGEITGGHAIARQLWAAGYATPVFPVWEMAEHLVHVTHATAAVATGSALKHSRAQQKAEARARQMLNSDWVQALRQATELDAA
ncbi:MAG TPA: glycosyl transferase [Planctomycetaceae bacterium]|jgi:hypothetical protein|nr:glycosyl transferase [Planctomycetaceae bacterium]